MAQTRVSRPRNRWRIVSACVAGADHTRCGDGGQDAVEWDLVSDLLIAAVADGAGSAAQGGIGAQVAVRAAVESLRCAPRRRLLTDAESCLRDAHMAALHAIRLKAQEADTREFATTLIVLIAGPNRVASMQVGDGAVVVADHAGEMELMSAPQSGEFINETRFLTSDASIEGAALRVLECAVSHVAAMTDGLQQLALRLADGSPHAPFFAPLFRFVSNPATDLHGDELADFLRSGRVQERTGDDITLLLAALTK